MHFMHIDFTSFILFTFRKRESAFVLKYYSNITQYLAP